MMGYLMGLFSLICEKKPPTPAVQSKVMYFLGVNPLYFLKVLQK